MPQLLYVLANSAMVYTPCAVDQTKQRLKLAIIRLEGPMLAPGLSSSKYLNVAGSCCDSAIDSKEEFSEILINK